METARLASLIAATVMMGLVSGLFYGFAISVMPGLKGADDRTVIEVMQRVNVAILNGWFILGYLGAFVCTALALALHVPSDGSAVLPALIAALVCYIGSMGITNKVNIPLNNALEKGRPGCGRQRTGCRSPRLRGSMGARQHLAHRAVHGLGRFPGLGLVPARQDALSAGRRLARRESPAYAD